MKIPCEIVQDLIPLMADDVCSAESRKAVLEHIENCERCKAIFADSRKQLPLELTAEEASAEKAVGKGLRKVKRRWIASILAVVVLISLFSLAWGKLQRFQERGVSYSNLQEFHIANAFMKALQKKDYDGAFQYLDIESTREEWRKEWFDEDKLANFEEDARRVFYASADKLIEVGGITDYTFVLITDGGFRYRVFYNITVGGKQQSLEVYVTEKGIERFSNDESFLTDPVARLAMWKEYLWQGYAGCYYDSETKQYVYNDKDPQ